MSDFEQVLREWAEKNARDAVPERDALRIVEAMRKNAPGKLTEWLLAQAPGLVADRLRELVRSAVSRECAARPAKAFSKWANGEGDDDSGSTERASGPTLRTKEIAQRTTPNSVWTIAPKKPSKRLAEMTHADLTGAITTRVEASNAALLQAAFLRAVQARVPNDDTTTVEDVWTAEQVDELERDEQLAVTA